nr:zf-HC2 domain-containing protein [Kibdelosporangium sp. MJ126-NF4]CEL15451.1 PROBABLE CONSERVED MEMBRANE PROTEIN [Kibdelosporangium sp. MJ126-NF4]CTQ92147.1 PROBABLE CONSERVED MEMBRANE PROTEIN [Kibdelosporangium sp. MJ126-NF4]
MTCRHTVSLGAYLLGALDPADRPEFERHLDACPQCSAEMLRLAPLPGLLQRVTPEDFEAIQQADSRSWPAEPMADLPAEPPGQQLAPVVLTPVEPAPEPKVGWWRKRGVTLVAVVAVVLLAVGGVIMFRPDGNTVATEVTWSAIDPTTGVHGRVELTGRAWGTEMKVSMQDVPAGRKVCHLVVHSRDGSSEVAGKWSAGYYREISAIPGSSSIKLGDIDRVEVMAGGGVLVGMQSP